jgi:hypothetical protein
MLLGVRTLSVTDDGPGYGLHLHIEVTFDNRLRSVKLPDLRTETVLKKISEALCQK